MKTILVIDDDAVVRTLLARYLSSHGWRVWEAEDGETGLALAQKHQPAVVLCDLLLPGLNGFEVCATISRDPAFQATRVIAMSGKPYPQDRKTALESGAEEFLLKPINAPALLFLLEKTVQRVPAKKTAVTAGSKQPTLLRFWGVRGSIPAPGPSTVFYGGNTPCLEVRTHGNIIILDSGTGIRPLGAALAAEFKDQPLEVTILLTHTHWDHIQGFPFFAPIYDSKNKIRVIGYQGAREGLIRTIATQMERPHFPVSLNELPGHISIEELKELTFKVGKLSVHATFANHPGVCLGYRLETKPGPLVYMPDNEPYLRQVAPDLRSPGAASKLQFARAEDEKMLRFIHRAEALVLDAQYDIDEYHARSGWGHACLEDTVSLAHRAQARRLYLFHHDPDHSDQKITQMVETARQIAARLGSKLSIEAAREGDQLIL